MSEEAINCCQVLLNEYFGGIVANVGTNLLRLGEAPFKLIVIYSKIKAIQVRFLKKILPTPPISVFSKQLTITFSN